MKSFDTTTEKKPIAPTLREMNIGDVEEYPRERHRSLRTIICDVQIETGMKFSKQFDGSVLKVTRTA